MSTPTYLSSPAETLKVVEEVDMRGFIDKVRQVHTPKADTATGT